MIPPFILLHWRLIAAGSAAAVLLSFSGCQTVRLHLAQADLKVSRAALKTEAAAHSADNARAAANQKAADAALSRCNGSVEGVRAAGASATAAAEKAAQRALGAATEANKKAASVLARKRTGDTCADIHSLRVEQTR